MIVEVGYFGQNYEVSVGVDRAMKVLASQAFEVLIPKIGYEVRILTSECGLFQLKLINVSGQLIFGCYNLTKNKWINYFRFDPEKLKFV